VNTSETDQMSLANVTKLQTHQCILRFTVGELRARKCGGRYNPQARGKAPPIPKAGILALRRIQARVWPPCATHPTRMTTCDAASPALGSAENNHSVLTSARQSCREIGYKMRFQDHTVSSRRQQIALSCCASAHSNLHMSSLARWHAVCQRGERRRFKT
jgi:hypothetical protein